MRTRPGILLFCTLFLMTAAFGQLTPTADSKMAAGPITRVKAGTDLTGGGSGGTVTLNLNIHKVPQLATANTFTADQTVNGNLTVSNRLIGSGFQIGNNLFDYGSYASENAYVGFAGPSSSGRGGTGTGNTGGGVGALGLATTGSYNTAIGLFAMVNSLSGNYNTGIGLFSLTYNTSGNYNTGIGANAGTTIDLSNIVESNNTAVGAGAAFSTGTLTNTTVIGSNAEATESNTLILGCIAGMNNCAASVSVGIGTTAPDNLLTVNGSADKPGGGSWDTYSDGRLKNLNGDFSSGLSQILQIHPIRYRYKPDNALGIRDSEEHVGVVAQEVQQVIPEAVTENSKGYLLVNNDPVLWAMVNAIKEQQQQIQQQQELLRAQTTAMQSLKAEVREARESLQKVKAQVAAAQPGLVAGK